jgi:intracellular sulfur oxidation DsrE/DsrF family protein
MTTRSEFITALAGAAAVVPAVTASPPAAKAAKKKPFHFDRARFEAILNKSARHKQCFGSKEIDGGTVLYAMQNSMNAYEDFLEEGPGSMQAVAVLYHGASIAIAMSSSVWNDLLFPSLKKLPEDIRKNFSDAAPGKGNPYLAKNLLPGMVARGCSFFVCHNALAGFAGLASTSLKRPYESVHRELLAGIVPGALVVPAGVMAINACQEAKFTYIATN